MRHQTRAEKALIGLRPAHDKTPRVQGGDRANHPTCQVFFSHGVIIFFRLKLPFFHRLYDRHFDAECLNLSIGDNQIKILPRHVPQCLFPARDPSPSRLLQRWTGKSSHPRFVAEIDG